MKLRKRKAMWEEPIIFIPIFGLGLMPRIVTNRASLGKDRIISIGNNN